jgi:hypothetical protein
VVRQRFAKPLFPGSNPGGAFEVEKPDSKRNATMALDQEVSVYNAHLIDLLLNKGKYVLIAGAEIGGVVESYERALEARYEKYGLEPFLIKQISRAEPIYYFSRDLRACPS